MRDQPLTYAALASTARLMQLGVTLPPVIPPGSQVGEPRPLDVELPAQVALLHELGLDRDAEAELRSSERGLARFGARSGEALCTMYGLLDTAARRYQLAQTSVTQGALMVAPTPATRWQWDCVYPRPFAEATRKTAEAVGVEKALLYSIMRQESAFRVGAGSPVGARGLMQLMPRTAERVAEEHGRPYDEARLVEPGVSIELSSRYLKKLMDAFGGSVPLALAAYNAGPTAVRRWLENAPTIPLDVFLARIPYDETLEYVERVVSNFARYRYLEGGADAVPYLDLALPAVPPEAAVPY